VTGQASGRNMGLLLNQTEPGAVRIMQRSLEVYRALAGGEVDFQLREMPQLIIASDAAQARAMGRRPRDERSGPGGERSRSRGDPGQFQSAGPRLAGGHVVGNASVVDPIAATFAFVEAAREAGAKIHTGTRVSQVSTTGGKLRGLVTDGGRFAFDAVVLAAGRWLNELWIPAPVSIGRGWLLRAARLDYTLPWIVEDMNWPDRDELGRVARPPTLAEVAAGHDQPVAEAFVIAQQPAGDALIGTSLSPSLRDPDEGLDMPRRIAARTVAAAPGLAELPITAAWYGLRPMTPDGMPLAGPAGPTGVWIHGGHASIAMMTAPAMAGWLTRATVGGVQPPELADLRVDRF